MASRNTPGTKNAGKTKEQRRREAREQAEKLRQEEARRARRNRIFLIVASLLVVALVAVAVYIIMTSSKKTDDADSTKFTHKGRVITEQAPKNVGEWGGVSVGKNLVAGTSNKGVPEVTIYTDYACHYCGQLEERFGSQLEEMAKDGEITLTYVPVNIYSDNEYASMGSQADYFIAANDPEHYLAYRALMWSKLSNPYLSAQGNQMPQLSDILDVAKEAGLSDELVSQLGDALNSGLYADYVAQVTQQLRVDRKASTPTVLINDDVLENWPTLPDAIKEYQTASATATATAEES
ncbi:thioredoxin domain-containing protein [Actinobaculum sp. 352]|uniref:DsbA family protein n=1 Tax=Actinobaculum sp. 352 TaxID=2490946 RepID=UPI000F7D72C3|nr:thioredoxin domain-containing protein [Actinobaculum sp. 352]RTE49267.1 hypothetical protein EKN07_06775 [Actinobaculum sp. 352]